MRFEEVLNELKENHGKGFRREVWEAERYITVYDGKPANCIFGKSTSPMFVTVYPIGDEEYGYSRFYPNFEEAIAEDWVEVKELPYTAEEWVRINLLYDVTDHLGDADDSLESALHIIEDMDDVADLYEKLSGIERKLDDALKMAECYREKAEKKKEGRKCR